MMTLLMLTLLMMMLMIIMVLKMTMLMLDIMKVLVGIGDYGKYCNDGDDYFNRGIGKGNGVFGGFREEAFD